MQPPALLLVSRRRPLHPPGYTLRVSMCTRMLSYIRVPMRCRGQPACPPACVCMCVHPPCVPQCVAAPVHVVRHICVSYIGYWFGKWVVPRIGVNCLYGSCSISRATVSEHTQHARMCPACIAGAWACCIRTPLWRNAPPHARGLAARHGARD